MSGDYRMRRLSHEYVKKLFEKEGYKLLSEYKNRRTKIKYGCINDHVRYMWPGDFKNGIRCAECAGLVKKNINFIKSEFADEDYILLTTEYINAHQKLKYICPNGHTYSMSWAMWQQGSRCAYCAGIGKPDIKFIRSEFKKHNYMLLTGEYKNNRQKLEYTCPSGHAHSISWVKWLNGRRCPICANINNSGSGHPNWKGGIACEPYCEVWADKEYKSDMCDRDNNECQNPSCRGISEKLMIHHIDYDKKNCPPSNLITLCNSCNSRANFNREWHTEFYRKILTKSQGYTYE